MLRQSRLHTLVQNWLGLTRYETDQVVSQMADMADLDELDDTQIRKLSEEAFECLNENRTLGHAVFNRL